jgi:hypothetical protein
MFHFCPVRASLLCPTLVADKVRCVDNTPEQSTDLLATSVVDEDDSDSADSVRCVQARS